MFSRCSIFCALVVHALTCAVANASDFDAVRFNNPYSRSLTVEVRVGKPLETGNDCERNELLTSKVLRPDEKMTVSCSDTYGTFCVRVREVGADRWSDWDGTYTCGGHWAKSKSRIKDMDLHR